MEINEFSSAKQIRNFRTLVNPKTKVVASADPSGTLPPGLDRHFTRLDGAATVFVLSTSTGSQAEANYLAMKDRRVFQVVVSGVAQPSRIGEEAMQIILSHA